MITVDSLDYMAGIASWRSEVVSRLLNTRLCYQIHHDAGMRQPHGNSGGATLLGTSGQLQLSLIMNGDEYHGHNVSD